MLTSIKKGARLACAVAAAGIFAAAQAAVAGPGTVNYVEGQVNLDGRALAGRSIGSTEVNTRQTLRTEQGRAEMLLTPGIFLRLGQHSAVRMLSPSLTDTRVELVKGEALVEVTQLFKQNRIDVLDGAATTQLLKRGLYRFNADTPQVAVLDGQAEVKGDDGQRVTVKKGKAVDLESGSLKPEKFDRKAAEKNDPLYAWSNLRSQYLSAANLATAQTVIVNGPGWIGSGWYWNPWWDTWAFLPADGLLYSPFGWGYYSPRYLYAYGPPVYYRSPRYSGGGWQRGAVGVPSRGARPAPAPAPSAPAPAPPPARLPANGVHFGK